MVLRGKYFANFEDSNTTFSQKYQQNSELVALYAIKSPNTSGYPAHRAND